MDREWLTIFTHLIVATIAGGLIGLERSYHGRPAGFRTHTLVCLKLCVNIADSNVPIVALCSLKEWLGLIQKGT